MINISILQSSFLNRYRHILAVCILLLIGFSLRIYHPENYEFGFDQIQILQKSEEITHGDFSLVGPRTGPADLFTGPLVYYVTAVFLMMSNYSPYALVGLVGCISLVSGIALYVMSRRATNQSIAFSLLAVWSCGPLFINLDRFAWNPILSLPASAMVFFGVLSILKRNKLSTVDLVLIFAGSFLGYQAHFSCLILPFLVLISFAVLKRKYVWTFFVSLFGLGLSVVPTLLFDLRQNWHNTKGLSALIFNKDKVETKFDFLRLFSDVRISFENIGKVFFPGSNGTFLVLFGVLIIIASLLLIRKNKEIKNSIIFSLLWIGTIAICFSFYRQSKPEYYFLVQFPAIFILILEVMSAFLNKSVEKALIIFFCLYGVLYSMGLQQKLNGFGLGAQHEAAADIVSRLKSGKIDDVKYGMKQIEAEGIKFFIQQQNVDVALNGSDLYVLYPVTDKRTVDTRYGAIGIWDDTRTDVQKNYLSLEDYMIITPKNITLLEDHYLSSQYDGNSVYQIIKDGQLTQDLLITINKEEYIKDLFEEIQNVVRDDPWQTINIKQYQGRAFYTPKKDMILVYIDSNEPQETFSELFDIQ